MKRFRLPAAGMCFVLALIIIQACSKNSSQNLVAPPPPPAGKILYNVVYGSNLDWQGNNTQLDMDIYFPADLVAGKKYPVAVQIHAGSFYGGKKEGLASQCQVLADSGFIAVTINYRLGWDHSTNCSGDTSSLLLATYRAFQDANAALRFLVSKADEYSIDTSWIFVGGISAGAVTALNISYLTDAIVQTTSPETVKQLGGLHSSSNALTNTYTIKGISSIAGALSDSTLINSNQNFPTIFFQGDADEVIPVNIGTYLYCPNYNELFGSLCLYRRLTSNGQLAVAHILHGSGHENSDTSGYPDSFTMSNTACFYHKLMNHQSQASKIYYDMEYSCQ